jgi:hypothetical protein
MTVVEVEGGLATMDLFGAEEREDPEDQIG